jgi:hypothetical protein
MNRKTAAGTMCRTLLSSVGLLLCAPLATASADAGAAALVSCRVRTAQGERTYELRRAPANGGASAWTLVMRGLGHDIVLPLPGAEPAVGPGTVRLDYHSANGGRLVDLDVSSRGATLSVWADHGLEVNVDPDLDPRVDEMTIDKAPARCDVASAPAR